MGYIKGKALILAPGRVLGVLMRRRYQVYILGTSCIRKSQHKPTQKAGTSKDPVMVTVHPSVYHKKGGRQCPKKDQSWAQHIEQFNG